MNTITIYTDGGCSGNPGPGGWAFAMITDEDKPPVTGSGCCGYTTNNKMELTAVIEALKVVYDTECCAFPPIEVFTDSQYVKNGITTWIHSWIKNGWKTSSKQPVKNKELWISLKELTDKLPVSWHWVKGHSGVVLNELCDTLVREETAKASKGC